MFLMAEFVSRSYSLAKSLLVIAISRELGEMKFQKERTVMLFCATALQVLLAFRISMVVLRQRCIVTCRLYQKKEVFFQTIYIFYLGTMLSVN